MSGTYKCPEQMASQAALIGTCTSAPNLPPGHLLKVGLPLSSFHKVDPSPLSLVRKASSITEGARTAARKALCRELGSTKNTQAPLQDPGARPCAA